jgi:DNA-binding MarR family transcriptional regulator
MHLGTARMTDFANALGVPLSTATHTVNRLVRRDLVTRAHSDRDRRLITVQMSERGSRYATAALDRRFESAREMLASLSFAEREMLLELIGKIAGLPTR